MGKRKYPQWGYWLKKINSYKDDPENQDSIIGIAWLQDKVSFAIRVQKQYFATVTPTQ